MVILFHSEKTRIAAKESNECVEYFFMRESSENLKERVVIFYFEVLVSV